jgi:hypothetical protein
MHRSGRQPGLSFQDGRTRHRPRPPLRRGPDSSRDPRTPPRCPQADPRPIPMDAAKARRTSRLSGVGPVGQCSAGVRVVSSRCEGQQHHAKRASEKTYATGKPVTGRFTRQRPQMHGRSTPGFPGHALGHHKDSLPVRQQVYVCRLPLVRLLPGKAGSSHPPVAYRVARLSVSRGQAAQDAQRHGQDRVAIVTLLCLAVALS